MATTRPRADDPPGGAVVLGTADDDGDVRKAYDGEWVELVSFPEDAVHWIVRDGEDVDE